MTDLRLIKPLPLQPLWNNCIIFIAPLKGFSLWLNSDRFGLDWSWSALSAQSSTYSQMYGVKGKIPIVDKGVGGGEGHKIDRQRENSGKRWTERARGVDKQRDGLSLASVQRRLHAPSVLTLIQPNRQQVPLHFSRQLILREPSKERFQRGLNKSTQIFWANYHDRKRRG